MRFVTVLLLLLISGVIFVNGWTDAPNAIVGVVSTKTMTYRRAVWLAACCNLLGLFIVSAINSSVADTMVSLAGFDSSFEKSIAALLAAMAAIIVFAVGAWIFGVPSSESHALIAAVTGARMAQGGVIPSGAWNKVIWGLVISLALSLALGIFIARIMEKVLVTAPGRILDSAQVLAAAGMAFMHGAQDGQKFAAVLIAAELLFNKGYRPGSIDLREHALVVFLCGALMALGTSVGGKRIVENVGGKMVTLKKWQSVAADLTSGLCLLLASFTGIPMSTTHTKTAAIMGACILDKRNPVNYKIIGGILLAWVITFPVCMAMGYAFTKLFLRGFL